MDALERACSLKLMVSFDGYDAPAALLDRIAVRHISGVTLFRHSNVESPAQVRRLTESLQAAAARAGRPPLLIGADQEGGQLTAVPGGMPFPGNMALGAAGSVDLAYRAGAAVGLELAAMGINVNYAPVCDVLTDTGHPSVGIRSFGEDPAAVARLAAALVAGFQSAGVAATAKHFPGLGSTRGDSHHVLPVVDFGRERLDAIDLPPFAAAIQAGARLIMTAHVAIPALNGGLAVPSTLSRPVLAGLLRREMGFRGVVITDALNMAALDQGVTLMLDAVTAAAAGVDLMLSVGNEDALYGALLHAARRGLLSRTGLSASARRILALRDWVGRTPRPPLDVVGCAGHRQLAADIAARSTTLLRDDAHLLPLRPTPGARWLAAVPRTADLTPADTSSYVTCGLAQALRQAAPGVTVDEVVVPQAPGESDVAGVLLQAGGCDRVIVGTINAIGQPGQAALVNRLVESGVPTVAVALRLPHDVQATPAAPTCVCTYGLLEPSMTALARAVVGRAAFLGRLPVAVGAEYAIGHGMDKPRG